MRSRPIKDACIAYFKEMLPEAEFEAFIEQLRKGRVRKALRINTLLPVDKKVATKGMKLDQLPWNQNGYFYESEESIGNTEGYKRGWLYSQEATSQIAVELMDVRPGQIVLDMCAAPGSKTSQIAADGENNIFLVANEIDPKRYKKLENTMAHYGIICHALTCMDCSYFNSNHPNTYDRILVDAPCSGEGMYFKYPELMKNWNIKTVKHNAKRQKRLLAQAFEALKPGGKIVYSTCTLNLEENEKVVDHILKKYLGNAELVSIDTKKLGFYDKNSKRFKAKEPMLKLWPHYYGTGGFFACVIRKKSATPVKVKEKKYTSRQLRSGHRQSQKSDAKISWQICPKKEALSVCKHVEKKLGKPFEIPENYVVVKNTKAPGLYFLQHRRYYSQFKTLPVREVGLPLVKIYEDGNERVTAETLRWLNIE